MAFNIQDFAQKVVKRMEEKLVYHQMLAKNTKQTVKLNRHLADIKLWEEAICDYKKEHGL